MSLIKRRSDGSTIPFFRSNLSELFDINRMFDDASFIPPKWNNQLFTQVPAANIHETEKEYVLELAIPGMKKDDFIVDLDDQILEIKVEKEEERKEEKRDYTRKEYDYSAFYRSFNLPDAVKPDKINAEYKDGILSIHVPKALETKKPEVKKIPVS